MTDAQFWTSWQIWLAVAAAIVLVAAGLLIVILITARRILSEAVRALNAAESIRANTQAIWALETTNEVAARMRDTVDDIAKKGAALVDALQGAAAGGRRAQ